MSDYSSFFLNTPSKIIRYKTVELSHPNFSKTYRIIENNALGATLTIEDGTQQYFEYYPLKIEKAKNTTDLEQEITFTFGDVGDSIPYELDRVKSANGMLTKPTIIYREYRSDDTTAPIYGPLTLELPKMSSDKQGSTFTAQARQLNLNMTGRIYDISGKFRTLRGFL